MRVNEQRLDEYLDDLERQQVEAIKAEFEEFRQRVDAYGVWLDDIILEHKELMQRMEASNETK